MRFYGLEIPERFRCQEPSAPGDWPYTGEYSAFHKWKLPGVNCPACRAIWGGGPAYPGADLSGLPEVRKFEEAYLEEDFSEFERLRELVRPLVPPGALLEPGTKFGPLVGSARGTFAQLFMILDDLLIRREALEQLQAEGIRGLNAFSTQLRFRQRKAPELLELQIEPHGLLHRDCIPRGKAEPCGKCGRYDFSLPKKPLLARASLPEHLDLFRLANFTTVIVASERLVEVIRRLGFEEVSIRELPLR